MGTRKKKVTWVGAAEANKVFEYKDQRSIARLAKSYKVPTKKHPKNPSWNVYDFDRLTEAFNERAKRPTDGTVAKNLAHENLRLRQQVRELLRARDVPAHKFKTGAVKFGVVSDVHIGSLYCNFTALEAAYDTFQKEGIEHVYLPGDLTAGEFMYRGQIYENYAHGADDQVQEVRQSFPVKPGITTHFILGNHDLSFWKRAGVDIGEKIAKREDMDYIGQEQADVPIETPNGKIILRLSHPGKGTAYALSYHPQKYIEQLSGGEKPHIILFGHWHKAELIPMYRNVCAVQSGTCESQTPFMQRNNIAAHVGFWIIEATVNEPELVSRFRAEFFAVFEESRK